MVRHAGLYTPPQQYLGDAIRLAYDMKVIEHAIARGEGRIDA